MIDFLAAFENERADTEDAGDTEAEETDENTGDDEPDQEGGAPEAPTTPDTVAPRQLRRRAGGKP